MAPPQVDDEYNEQIKNARKQLDAKLISDTKKHAPLMLHLALHDAGIYGNVTGNDYYLIKRGPNGSIKTEEELKYPPNEPLKEAVKLCEGVKDTNQKITYADLYQLAGVAAVEITGGPTIEFVPGREDSTEYPEEGRLPSKDGLDVSQLEKITKRMGLEEKDMVALFGGLYQWTVPRASPKPTSGPGITPVDKFDNSYFIDLKKKKDQGDQTNPLLKGAGFSKWVETYAKDEGVFLKDYAAAHKKVSELGMSVATSGKGDTTQTEMSVPTSAKGDTTQTDHKSSDSGSRNRVRLVRGIGIAVVTTAIILGFFLSRRTK